MEDMKKLGSPESGRARAPVIIGPSHAIDARPILQTAAPDDEPKSLLVEYYRMLVGHRWRIAAFALVGACLAFLISLMTQPVFRARTSLDIQNLNIDFMNMRAVATTGQGGPASGEIYIQTEIKLLQSDTLLRRAANRMKEEAERTVTASATSLQKLKQALHLPGSEPHSPQETLDYTVKSVAVKPLGLTRLVEVTCDSWDAKFAANFCNTLISEFQQQDREIRWSDAQRTGEWLSRQLADVREQLTLSERKLQAAQDRSGVLLSGQQNGSVGEQKLRELQSELLKAQADRVDKQAKYEISRAATPDSLPVILDDTQLRDYQTKLVDLRRTLAESMPPLTDAHPKIQKLKAQIRELEGELSGKKTNVMARMRNEFEAARQREQLLLAAYHSQELRVAQELSQETQMNMLRRDVESGQQLYQTLSQRVKEAGLVSAMQATTIRVVDAALTPALPIVPRRVRSVAVGLILGAVAGICFAFFKERMETVLRIPGESSRYLNIRELGVIPSARVGLNKVYANKLAKLSAHSEFLLAGASGGNDSRFKTDQVIDLATWKSHASLVAEAYRSTTYSILLEGRQFDRGKSYVISSPSAGEGKTTVTCNLGIALAQANRRVLVIDGDLRCPRLHKSMGVSNEVGLREVLRGDVDFEKGALDKFCRPSQVPNMFILPSGSGSEEPSSLLYSPRLRPLLDRLTKEFDVILMDTPPVLHLADARILAGATDGVILVLRARSTDRETAMNARDLFHHDQVRIVGTILNDFDPLSQGRLNYYDSYYKYANAAGDLRKA